MFEAAAMSAQFEAYTNHVTLVPLKGDPSVAYKWEIAERFNEAAVSYPDKDLVILYFEDLDPKGMQIPLSAMADIDEWSEGSYIEFVRCGLNPGDEVTYAIPEKPEAPGRYQWEALDDIAAGNIITTSLAEYVDQDLFIEVEAEEAKITAKYYEAMEGVLDDLDLDG